MNREGGCRRNRGNGTGDVTANLPSDDRSFHFLLQEGHKPSYVSFVKLFTLRVNDPPPAYIVWESPKVYFGREFYRSCLYSLPGLVRPGVGGYTRRK